MRSAVATGEFGLPPHQLLRELWSANMDWLEHWRSNVGIEPTRHLGKARDQSAGVVRHVEGKTSAGVTLLESMFDREVGLRLMEFKETTIHTWPARFSEIFPNPQIVDTELGLPGNDWEVLIHGSALYPDGDVLFNFAGLGLVRMDACGDVEWKLPVKSHHSIDIADDGDIWTLGHQYYDRGMPEFPGLRPRFRDDLVLEISPEGQVLRKWSVLRILYRNDLVGALFPIGIDPLENEPMTNLLHTNDVETLSAEDASAFPLFEAGDALVSIRNLNLLIVFDPGTGAVKWAQTGPWLRQHDPDFMPDGRIMVFDNRNDDAGGRLLGGSRLLAIDPVSREVETLYEGTEREPFFTAGRGRAQQLDNGNFLITETQFGRVFEATPDGEIVWSFVNRFDADQIVHVNGATRYPESYGRFDRSACRRTSLSEKL
jgi:Arylsulfotransferase (ASST)